MGNVAVFHLTGWQCLGSGWFLGVMTVICIDLIIMRVRGYMSDWS